MNIEKNTPSILIALGGNALDIKEISGLTTREEYKIGKRSVGSIVDLIRNGHNKIVITHGNGPQVGRILFQQELTRDHFSRMTPLDVCVADTQGRIGHILQNSLNNACFEQKVNLNTVSLVTQVLVDENDDNFLNPKKPIGSFYTKEEALQLERKRGWKIKEEAQKGYRRVVPSPKPIDVIEKDIIKCLMDQDIVTIVGGGGGIPVIKKNGNLEGVEAVIDKDRTSSLLANLIGIDIFIILTEAYYVCLNYGTPDEKKLENISLNELEQYYEEGHFPAGNMGPKVESAISFLKNGGKKVIIGNLFKLTECLNGLSGTTIHT